MTNYNLEPVIKQKKEIIVGDPGQRGRDKILIGKLIETGPRRTLYLDITGEQVVAILGKRGSGKSYTLGVIIEALSSGHSETIISRLETPRAALVIDIMDIYWSTSIPLSNDGSPELTRQYEVMKTGGYSTQDLHLDIWIPDGFQNSDIDPPGINPLKIQANHLELDDWAALFDVDIFTEPRGMLVADMISHVQEGYMRDDKTTTPPNDNFNFGDLLVCLDSDTDLSNNYHTETIRSIRQRLSTYSAMPLFSGQGTELVDLLKTFRTSILMMARVPDELKKVIVAVLTRRIMRQRRDASLAQKRLDLDPALDDSERTELESFIANRIPRTWLLMDEAHVLVGKGEGSIAKEALIKYAKEGRNYGLSLAVATQQPGALDNRLMSQVETLIVHQLTAPIDAAVASDSIRSPIPEKITVDGNECDMKSLFRRLRQGEIIFSCGNAPQLPRVCVSNVRPRISAHGGYEA